MIDEEKIKYRDAFPKDYDLPTYFTSKHAVSMHLRDYFATHAMQALIDNDGLFSGIPTQAYALADAMLKAREQ
jgi:hypothetical protein